MEGGMQKMRERIELVGNLRLVMPAKAGIQNFLSDFAE